MNPWQLTQEIISRLNPTNLKWEEGALEPVLGRVVAAPAPAGFFRHDTPTPYALVQLESARHNEEHPADLIDEARWSLYLIAGNANEQGGSAAVVGGNRAALGSSRGRGLLEIEALVLKKLFNAVGLSARPRGVATRPPTIPDELAGVVTMRALEIVATRISVLPDYPPIRRIKASAIEIGGSHGFLVFTTLPDVITITVTVAGTPYAFVAGTDFTVGPTVSDTALAIRNAINARAGLSALVTASLDPNDSAFVNVAAVVSGTVIVCASTEETFIGSFNGTSGSGARLSWAAAPSNYALVGYAWAAAAGSTAPTDPTAGTFVADPTSTGFDDPSGAGTWTYSVWWAFDATRDPFFASGVVPIAANRWSSQQSAQAGLVYIPASVTVVVP